jgi:hypothetical protein
MRLNLRRVRENVQKATTEDLLDRATVYRDGMEPEALAIIDAELDERGVSAARRQAHETLRRERALPAADGLPRKCQRCPRPAVVSGWYWHRLWGVLPLFPERQAFCEEHAPSSNA